MCNTKRIDKSRCLNWLREASAHRTWLRVGARLLRMGGRITLALLISSSAVFAAPRTHISDKRVVRLSDVFPKAAQTPKGQHRVVASLEPGEHRHVSAQKLRRALRSAGISEAVPPEGLDLRRACYHPNGEDLAPILREYAGDPPIPNGRYRFEIRGRLRGAMATKEELDTAQLEEFRRLGQDLFWMRLRAKDGTNTVEGRVNRVLERPVVVLRTLKRKSERLNPDDLSVQLLPTTSLSASHHDDTNRVVGLACRRNLSPGTPISQNDLEAPIAVKKNDQVWLVNKKGGLTLKLKTRALQEGRIGETISILAHNGEKTLYGTVRDEGKVELQ